jgi:hypothetical protein
MSLEFWWVVSRTLFKCLPGDACAVSNRASRENEVGAEKAVSRGSLGAFLTVRGCGSSVITGQEQELNLVKRAVGILGIRSGAEGLCRFL